MGRNTHLKAVNEHNIVQSTSAASRLMSLTATALSLRVGSLTLGVKQRAPFPTTPPSPLYLILERKACSHAGILAVHERFISIHKSFYYSKNMYS